MEIVERNMSKADMRGTAVLPHLRGAKIVLRSKTPDLVRQEFYGFIMAHFAIRGLMHEAALQADKDPDELSFLHTVRVVRRKLPRFATIPPSAEAYIS